MIASFVERRERPPPLSTYPNPNRKHASALPPLATVSRKWQHAIEKRTFREVTVRSDEIDRFRATCTGYRRHWVTFLRYNVVLPTYSDQACARFERASDKAANDEAFTRAIELLLGTLKS